MASSEPSGVAPAGRGIVLALNFVPAHVEPAIHRFWRALADALALQGQTLVVMTTTPLDDPAVHSLPVSYQLSDLLQAHPDVCAWPVDPSDPLVRRVADWHTLPAAEAQRVVGLARAWCHDLLRALRPCAVIGWQSAHPLTMVLTEAARQQQLPTWSAERGWIAGTLMFDIADNHHLGEVNRSLLARQLLAQHPRPDEARRAWLKERVLHGRVGRYEEDSCGNGQALRQRLGIAPDRTVFAFFSHCEPYLWAGDGALAELHGLDASGYAHALEQLVAYCRDRGHAVLVQDHPFNRQGPHAFAHHGEHIHVLQENVHTVLEAADRAVFTMSTVQAYAVCHDRPFGLLTRSFLHDARGAWFHGDFADTATFLESIERANDWAPRRDQLWRRLDFLYQHSLLDLDTNELAASARRLAGVLDQFERMVSPDLDQAIVGYLDRWGR